MQCWRISKSGLKNLKAEFLTLLLIPCLLFIGTGSQAQLLRADSINISSIRDATVDDYGNLYLSDAGGQILKIEPSPLRLIRYAGNLTLAFDKVDAGLMNKIAAFSKALQKVCFFDRNLNPIGELNLIPPLVQSTSCISMASDNNCWVFDETDLILKKINPVRNEVLAEFECGSLVGDRDPVILDLEAYRNRIYLLGSDQALHIFDSMGNLIRDWHHVQISRLQFLGDYLVMKTGDKIILKNLYDESEVDKTVPDSLNRGRVLITRDYIYSLDRDIRIFPNRDTLP